jgi:hypothetical protein
MNPHRTRVFTCFAGLLDATADSGMFDLAVNRDGKVFGSAKLGTPQEGTRVVIVSVEPETAGCEEVASFPITALGPQGIQLWGLGFLPQPGGEDQLFALDDGGLYVRVDLEKQTLTEVGNLNPQGVGPWFTKGADLVSIKGDRTYTTAARDDLGERLVAIDPATGQVQEDLGLLGKEAVGGLAYWGGVVFGFTSEGTIVTVDTKTGKTGLVPVFVPPGTVFQGAGVTTLAPITIK